MGGSSLNPRNRMRLLAYRVLSDLFAQPPDAQKIAQLAKAADADELLQDPIFGDLFHRLRSMGSAADAAERDLSGAYSFLFHGAGGPLAVPPYQSHFTDDRGRLCQDATAAMSKDLRGIKRHVSGDFPEPADHIAIQLQVAAELIINAAPETQQATFIADRLAAWLPEFSLACAKQDRDGFYGLLAQTANAFVADDLSRLIAETTITTQEEV